jgi:transmembrane sensor
MKSSDRAADRILEEAARWVARRHARGEQGPPFDPKQQQAWEDWLARDPSHRTIYENAERLWRGLEGLDAAAGSQLTAARAYASRARRRREAMRRGGRGVAAALVAAAALAPNWPPWARSESIRTAIGERRTLWLDDGSTIEVNTNSEIKVDDTWFGRKARLARGEALFAIVHSALRPFEVEAGGGLIRDLGTKFDISVEEDAVAVYVVEGEVSITAGVEAAGSIKPGYRQSFSRAGKITPAEPFDAEAAAAWADGELVIDARPLSDVLAELARYHTAAVKLAAPEFSAMTLSGVVPIDDMDAALQAIADALSLKLIRQGANAYVFAVANLQPSKR